MFPTVRLQWSFLVPPHLSNVPFPFPSTLRLPSGFRFGCCVSGSSHVGGCSSCSSFFFGCLLLLVLALVVVSACPPLYPSIVCFHFAFLVRIPPSRGFSGLSSVGFWAPPLPCATLYFSLSFGVVVFASPFSFRSLGALLPRSNLWSLRDGVPPLGRVSSIFRFLHSFLFLVPRMPFGTSELIVFSFSPSLGLDFVPLFRWIFSSCGSMLLLFWGFSHLRFGLGAFFVLMWFSFAVFRVGPSPALSSVSLFVQRFFGDVLFWSPFTFLPVCPCSPCLGRFLFLWCLFSFAWASGLLFGSSTRFLVAFSVFGVLRASLSVATSCLPSASAFCLLFFTSFMTRSNLSSFATGSSLCSVGCGFSVCAVFAIFIGLSLILFLGWLLRLWFHALLGLLVAAPGFLPSRMALLCLPHSHPFLRLLPVLRLSGCRLSSDPPAPAVSLPRCLETLPA